MRTIVAALLAAETCWPQRPYIHAIFANRRWRWTSVLSASGSTDWTDQAKVSTWIHRLRVNSTTLYQAKVYDPSTASQWTNWASLATGLQSYTDCAIGLGTKLTAFYVKPTHQVTYKASVDNGSSWSSESTLCTAASEPYLAADNDAAFVQSGSPSTVSAYRYSGGAWSAGAILTLTGVTGNYGLGAAWDNAAGLYRVAIAAGGRLYIASYNPATNAWDSPAQIAPGGTAAPSSSILIRACSVEVVSFVDTHYVISFVERYDDGSTSWENTLALRSSNWPHFGDEVALDVAGANTRKAALAWFSPTTSLYAAIERSACAWDVYQAAEGRFNLVCSDVLSYRRATTDAGSRVMVRLLNAGALDGIGQDGAEGECIRPLAELRVLRGYDIGDVGNESVALDPHYIVRAEVVERPDGHALEVLAVDGWGLLELWQPHELCLWSGQTVAWLLAAVCAKVGLSVETTGSAFAETIGTFAWGPGVTAAGAARQLLSLAGGVVRFGGDGVLQALQLASYSPSAHLDVGANGELLEGRYGLGIPTPTSPRVVASGRLTGLDTATLAMSTGLRLKRVFSDLRATSSATTTAMQDYLQLQGALTSKREELVVPLRVEAELWDLADVHAATSIIPAADRRRRVLELHESFESTSLAARTRMVLGGV